MVGDSVEDDIEGAAALGMRAVLIDREGRQQPDLGGGRPAARPAGACPRGLGAR